ncbi:MAG TPA: DedA family protein [Terrimesophilobacter sp.]|uniref:DedA family protein n=1 Tax=Terrimesophilobacter sp. TaxID=2906435 RepID=UPI002F939BD7
MNEILTWILETVQNVDPILRTLLAGLAILLETSVLIGLIMPGDTVVLVASTGISNGFEYVALILVVIAGAIAGESIGFALGRFFGPKIMTSRLGRKIGHDHWMRAENYLDRRGGIAVFVSRFLPVLHSLIPLTVGMSTMSYRKFLSWTLPACLIWSVAYASAGWAAAGTYRELSGSLHYAGYIFVAIILAFLLVVVLVKRLLERSQRRHMELPGDGDANTREDLP